MEAAQMLRKALVFGPLILLTGCVSATSMVMANGDYGYDISCGGLIHGMADCLKKAGEVCPDGYQMLGSNEAAIPYTMTNPYYNPVAGGVQQVNGTKIERDLLIQCSSPD
jgi:hypothetical protein